MAVTIIFITRGKAWEYRPILPLDGYKDGGFSEWYDLHGKMDFRTSDSISEIQELNYRRHKFFYLAYKLDSGNEDEAGRPIPIYFALISKNDRELDEFARYNAENIKNSLIKTQDEIHDIPYSDALNKKCKTVAHDITQKYLGPQTRRGLQGTSRNALTFMIIIIFSAMLVYAFK